MNGYEWVWDEWIRLAHRAVVIETVAAVPGLVGGLFVHLKSLRRIRHDHGWTNILLQEAENEKSEFIHMRICGSIQRCG